MRYEVTVLSDKELSGRKIMAITDNRQDAEEIAANLRIAGYKGVMIPQIQHIEGGYVMSNVTNEEMIRMLIEAMHELPEKDFRSVCTHLYGVITGARIALEQTDRESA